MGSNYKRAAIIGSTAAFIIIINIVFIVPLSIQRAYEASAGASAAAAASKARSASYSPALVGDELLEKLDALTSSDAIREISSQTYKTLPLPMAPVALLEYLGSTKQMGDGAKYFVRNGDSYSLLDVPLVPMQGVALTADKLTLIPLGMTLGAAASIYRSFEFPSEEALRNLINKGMTAADLFYDKLLKPEKYDPRKGIIIKGVPGYFPVAEGQKYKTVEELGVLLRTYFDEEAVRDILDLGIYAMKDGRMYVKYKYPESGSKLWSPDRVFFVSLNETSGVLTLSAPCEDYNGFRAQNFRVQKKDGRWILLDRPDAS